MVLRVPLVLFGLRFRSITKQYFRKADGILVMYDVTAECSFTAVQNWMSSVQVRVEQQLSNTGGAAAALLQTSPIWERCSPMARQVLLTLGR